LPESKKEPKSPRVPKTLARQVERAFKRYGDNDVENEEAMTTTHEALEALWAYVQRTGQVQ
jgi:hypothetical protein